MGLLWKVPPLLRKQNHLSKILPDLYAQ
jgi:hypothetical protein